MRARGSAEGRVVVVRTDPVRRHPVEHVRDVFVAVESVKQVQAVRRVADEDTKNVYYTAPTNHLPLGPNRQQTPLGFVRHISFPIVLYVSKLLGRMTP